MRSRPSRTAGWSLIETLAALSIAAMSIAVSVPGVVVARRYVVARGVARHVATAFRDASTQARRERRSLAWEVSESPLAMRLIADGDADGVRADDLRAGIDTVVRDWMPLGAGQPGVEARVACTGPDIDGDAVLEAGAPGLRFGGTRFVSFSASGAASSGTLYLRVVDSPSPALAIRVLGASGRVRVLELRADRRSWEAW